MPIQTGLAALLMSCAMHSVSDVSAPVAVLPPLYARWMNSLFGAS